MSTQIPTSNQNEAGEMITTDGVPLRVSLARARRRNRNKALLLVLPLFLFILVTFFIPITSMLFRSVENQLVGEMLHRTVPLLQQWDERGDQIPDEEVFVALAEDFREARENHTAGSVGRRLNYEESGFSSLFRVTARKIKKVEPPYQESFIAINKDWGKLDTWRILKRESRAYTVSYYLAAMDAGYSANGGNRTER